MSEELQTKDGNLCPLCKENNNCCSFSAELTTECWCTKEVFPQEIFSLVPKEQLRKSCICKKCLEEFEV